jgi:hypothetical protein
LEAVGHGEGSLLTEYYQHHRNGGCMRWFARCA